MKQSGVANKTIQTSCVVVAIRLPKFQRINVIGHVLLDAGRTGAGSAVGFIQNQRLSASGKASVFGCVQ